MVRVDIGAPLPAQLSLMSFEGVHKRNLPRLNQGDVVYARVINARTDIDPELSCVDAQVGASGHSAR